MAVIVIALLFAANILLFFLLAILLTEVSLAAITQSTGPAPNSADLQRGVCAVIVPAHNEGANAIPTLRDIRAQLAPGDRLIVVADNCTDDTAAVAASEGAEVIERVNPTLRGKGYALEFGVAHLRSAPPETVIIVDADCRLGTSALERLCAACASTRRPAQALYLMKAVDPGSPKRQVAEFAWLLKNLVRPLGLKAMRLPCHLTGSGMAFPWSVIGTANLGTAHIVEDLKLGVELAARRQAAEFCPSALITSCFPASEAATQGQRKRWEQGHLNLLLAEALPLLPAALRSGNWGLVALIADLAVPPLSLLVIAVSLLFLASLLQWVIGGHAAVVWFGALNAAVFAAAIALAWSIFGRAALPIRSVPHILSYFAAKLPFYSRMLRDRRPAGWVRTERDGSNV